MVKALLSAALKPELEAVSFFEPVRLMVRLANAAKPPASVVLFVVPLSAPEPVVRAIVTVTPEFVTLFPKTSFNWTVTTGAMTAPAVVVVGCWTKATWLAAAGKMVKALLVTGVAGALLAVSV